MKPLRLKLTGFRGIRDGMGRDTIDLDLPALVGDAQLVALAGPNGAGKTTLLDNLHPYRIMPSRAGADGLGDFSYYDHLCLPECEKLLDWEHANKRYRSQLLFKINGKRKTEAYLLEWQGASWAPVRLPDGTLSDGKTNTYDVCVEAILGSPATYFTSVFRAQGQRPLSSYSNGEVKTLMADLFGQEQLRDLGGRANEVVKLLRAGLAQRRESAAAVVREIDVLRPQAASLPLLTDRLKRAEEQKALAASALEQAAGDQARLQLELTQSAEVLARRAALQQELVAADRDQKAAANDVRTELARIESEHSAALQALNNAETKLCKEEAALTEKARSLQALQADSFRVLRARARIALRTSVLLGRRTRVAQLDAQVDQLGKAKHGLAALRLSIGACEREAGAAELNVTDLRRRLGLTAAVPCAGLPMQSGCELLGDAHKAHALLPNAQATINQLAERRRQLKDEEKGLVATIAGLGPSEALRLAARKRETVSASRLRLAELLAARFDELQRVTTELEEIALRRRAIEQELERLQTSRGERDGLTERQRTAINTRETAQREQVVDRKARAERELASLPTRDIRTEAQLAATGCDQARVRLQEAEAALQAAVLAVQASTNSAERLTLLSGQRVANDANLAHIESSLATWTCLSQAMGNDGIMALVLDDAGPTLAALANDLLLACYGPRFTVALNTQVATAKGEMREGFEIIVHDAQTDESKPLKHMSGGQRVWIHEALTRAVALYLALNSGRRYGALFSDESDGALDTESKRRYLSMKREVLRLGGYAVEFFISQTEELVDLADAVIDVASLSVSHTPAALQEEIAA